MEYCSSRLVDWGDGMDYKFIKERTHYYAPAINIVMSVTIGGAPSKVELQKAIHKAVKKHEIFNSKVYLDEKGDSFYSVIPEGMVKIETRDSDKEEDWKKIIHEQERIPFDFIHGELIRFFILKKVDAIGLVIVAHHLVGDGLAITYLIRDIMESLGNPFLSFQKMPIQLYNVESIPTGAILRPWILLLIKLSNKSWNKNKKVFQYAEYLDMFHSYWKNRKTAVESKVISGSDLTKLMEKCKANNVTMNSAIVTAFLLGVKVEKEVGMAASIRPEGYEGMGNYATGISINYSPDYNKSFWENTQIVQAYIYKKINDDKAKYFLLQFLRNIEPTLVDAAYFSAFAGFDNKMAGRYRDMFGYNNKKKGFSVTNLTKLKIPSVYGNYSIDNLDFVAPIVPNAKQIIGVVTLEDKMSITMQYEVKEDAENKKKDFENSIHILCSNM